MRISDWSSDVCSSDLLEAGLRLGIVGKEPGHLRECQPVTGVGDPSASREDKLHMRRMRKPRALDRNRQTLTAERGGKPCDVRIAAAQDRDVSRGERPMLRSEENTSELQSLMRN